MKQPDIIEVTIVGAGVLNDLGVDYYIGGSLASSAFGLARATMDVDIVADIKMEHVSRIVGKLERSFYIDQEMAERAIGERSSFNIVHLESMFKVDIFVPPDHPFEKLVFSRRLSRAVTEDGSRELFFSSPEDIILKKLIWYNSGGRISDRQWSDVLGVFKVQSESLDQSYLELWAAKLGVADLLDKASQDSGVGK
jgi:hypothetical protein